MKVLSFARCTKFSCEIYIETIKYFQKDDHIYIQKISDAKNNTLVHEYRKIVDLPSHMVSLLNTSSEIHLNVQSCRILKSRRIKSINNSNHRQSRFIRLHSNKNIFMVIGMSANSCAEVS